MRRYLILFAIVVALGATAALAGRSLRLAARPEAAPAARREVALDLTVMPGSRVTPGVASVPKDHLVRLSVTNRDSRPVALTLMGYEDRLGTARVAPDSVWRGEFVADRPGQDFAWVLDGTPAGRLEVAGSHLEEGRR